MENNENISFINESSLEYINESSEIASSKKAIKEQNNWDNLEKLENKRLYYEIERYKEDTSHRRTLSTWASIVVSFWLLSVIIILTGNHSYKLSDSVLIALLTTTTLNVLALMLVVLNDVFNKGKK